MLGGLIRAVTAGLRQSHGNTRSELHLQPMPHVTTSDPEPTEMAGIKHASSWILVRFLTR